MPRFLVKADTCVSHLGRVFKAGDIASFDLPQIKVLDARGKFTGKVKPMDVGDNLELIEDDKPKKQEPLA